MRFDPEMAEIRFGCGLSPAAMPVGSAEEMLQKLAGPDAAAERFPIPGFETAADNWRERRALGKAERRAKTDAAKAKAKKARKRLGRKIDADAATWLGQTLLRRALTADGFRERLAAFWTDHFTAVGTYTAIRMAQATYAEDTIRPHLAGRFPDMLRAVATHPMMLIYLDQRRSVGPSSKAAKRRNRLDGLNENLAREILELHTLGVGGPYTQADVRQFAELLTGLSWGHRHGFKFRANYTEPGSETVLGKTYGGGAPKIEDIHAALDDLATHPVTARHIAGKLAVHFVSDHPDPALVDAIAQRFEETGGDLMAVYEAMLSHPSAWDPAGGNVKRPIDFIGSSLRALDIVPRHMPGGTYKEMRELFFNPLALMGQKWGQAAGPDGWPEADDDWITPQRLAARLQWGMTVPFLLRRVLPDPRDFVEFALGSKAPETLRFAASAAESRAEGIGVVLASPAFQRT